MVEAYVWALTGCFAVILFLVSTFYLFVAIAYGVYLLIESLRAARKNHKK